MDALALGDALGSLGTEIVRLIMTFFFFTYIMKPIKSDVHSMRESVQNLFIKIAKMEDIKEHTTANRNDIQRLENMIHSIELNCKSCRNRTD